MNPDETRSGSSHVDGQPEEDRVDRVRRALLRAGWAVPVILALRIPVDAFAQYKKTADSPVEKKTST